MRDIHFNNDKLEVRTTKAGDEARRRTGAASTDVAERPLRSFLLTPLDEPRCHAGLRGLLASGSPLGDAFEQRAAATTQFYDYNALRTERGSPRQPVHWDTPFQERPPLYTAFVALQRVTREMGATLFLPGTHALGDGTRRGFDAGGAAKRAALEGARVFDGVLEPGDVTIFDMRVLHCGQPNLADRGDQRFFLNFTFCNPARTAATRPRALHPPGLRAAHDSPTSAPSSRPPRLRRPGDGLR
ncbi:phytanoyl-CoA dioxygenase [Aureococcus anophagefferens]|nr:phytanoyl-CoA dioxygenase [Aureococcus anophagefferens]